MVRGDVGGFADRRRPPSVLSRKAKWNAPCYPQRLCGSAALLSARLLAARGRGEDRYLQVHAPSALLCRLQASFAVRRRYRLGLPQHRRGIWMYLARRICALSGNRAPVAKRGVRLRSERAFETVGLGDRNSRVPGIQPPALSGVEQLHRISEAQSDGPPSVRPA